MYTLLSELSPLKKGDDTIHVPVLCECPSQSNPEKNKSTQDTKQCSACMSEVCLKHNHKRWWHKQLLLWYKVFVNPKMPQLNIPVYISAWVWLQQVHLTFILLASFNLPNVSVAYVPHVDVYVYNAAFCWATVIDAANIYKLAVCVIFNTYMYRCT